MISYHSIIPFKAGFPHLCLQPQFQLLRGLYALSIDTFLESTMPFHHPMPLQMLFQLFDVVFLPEKLFFTPQDQSLMIILSSDPGS